jgi:hypothetical protein
VMAALGKRKAVKSPSPSSSEGEEEEEAVNGNDSDHSSQPSQVFVSNQMRGLQ